MHILGELANHGTDIDNLPKGDSMQRPSRGLLKKSPCDVLGWKRHHDFLKDFNEMILNIDVLGPRILDRVLENVNGTVVTMDSHNCLQQCIMLQGQRYGILFLARPYEKKTKKIERSQ